jgi:hypothetical protein
MRIIISLVVYIGTICYLLQSCASPTGVTGGPRDTIPPTLIQSFPQDNTVNFNSTEITLTFDERIKADQLKSKLLITPLTENDFKFKINKEILTISFNQKFKDSTTYILNFADAVQDITESNPAINLRIAFSTGTFIDSAKITGTVKELLENKAGEGNIVSLYKIDTNSVFKNKPLYFTYTDKYGGYKLENLKPDQYRVYSFKDENKNLLLESATEEFGFISDTLKLINKLDSINIKTIKIDAAPFKTIRNSISGKYFEIRYSKPISKYNIAILDTTKTVKLKSTLTDDHTGIRLYPPDYDLDSIQLIIEARDTVSNVQIDTVMAKFQTSTRKNDAFNLTVSPNQKEMVLDSMSIRIIGNKPIINIDKQLIYIELQNKNRIRIDSLTRVKKVNHDNEVNIGIPKLSYFVKQFKSDTLDILARSELAKSDSTKYLEEKEKIETISETEYKVIIAKGALISIEQDTSQEMSVSYFEPDATSYGTVSGTISTTKPTYIIELIDKSFNVVKSIVTSDKNYKLTFVKPGSYSIRIKYNSSGKPWNIGNILKNEQPDKIYFLDKYFDIRANWDLENINISF